MSSSEQSRVDVLIIGAGPAGFMCANALANAKVNVRIVDKRSAKVTAGQADGISPRTVEVFQSYGIGERLLREGCQVHMAAFYNSNSTGGIENDYAAVLPPPGPVPPSAPHPLLTTEPVQGACDVVCFHPRHDLSLLTLEEEDVVSIVKEWTGIYQRRGTQTGIEYVQIFENKGAMMGCSNPHPHSQVWSLSTIPTLPAKELANLRAYATSPTATTAGPKGPNDQPCMLCEYAAHEIKAGERVVVKNEHFVALVPWWAYWPFELSSRAPDVTALSARYPFELALHQGEIEAIFLDSM
ncbi:hypothetical protein HYDPIDRAFT_34306 [Hydnomerulius pinastri MD-312]|uniref:Galactose-1-phosphate uridylyltransferase n=1 Tax=Hydnomerulius pinastri MD-312 TaxID=994086 RepID=A0A0C9W6E1_9AGAM|nr:hypothetical protein HYDPIDRAFT_34306 [Hydnomerulius pinastri MD-312]